MEPTQEYSDGRRPPRKELQGARPTPLKVRKESCKIRKPPIAPPPVVVHHQQPPQPPPPPPPRKPVIIYTVSPKVIHANPSEFMTLVQRLTGLDSTSSSSSTSSSQYPSSSSSGTSSTAFAGSSFSSSTEGIIPGARLAGSEKTKMPLDDKRLTGSTRVMEGEVIQKIIGGGVGGVERTVLFPGILSPGPGSLPQISPNLFSQFLNDPSVINLHHDLSPIQLGNKNFVETGTHNIPNPFATNNFMVSPNTTFSPSSLDLLHHILNN